MIKKDITDIEDIKLLVNTFYDSVRVDDMIGGIFHSVIKEWSVHLEKMYRFWETVLLENHTYNGAPFPPHAQMPVSKVHFERWLLLWNTTLDNLFAGEIAEEAKWRGHKMAGIFLSKIEYIKRSNFNPLV